MASSPLEILVRQAPPVKRPSPDAVVDSDGHIILAITGSLFGLTFLVVSLRCYIRAVMLKTFGLDDAAMLCALAMAIMCMVCISGMVINGAGRLEPEIPQEWLEQLGFWSYIIGVFIVTGVGFVKISIGLFLRRFTRNQIWHTRIIDGLTVFSTIFLLYSIFTFVFACFPLKAMWVVPSIRKAPGVTCMTGSMLGTLGTVNGAINITTDILYVLLPVPVVWALKTNMRTKVMLFAIFSLGLFACGAAIARMVYAPERGVGPYYTKRYNFIVWFFIELHVGILAASLPSLKPLFKSFFQAVSGITGQSYGHGQSNGSANRNPRSGYIKQSDNNSSIPLGSVHTGRVHSDYHAGVPPNPHNTSFMRDDGSEDGLFPQKGIEKKTEIHIRQEELRYHQEK